MPGEQQEEEQQLEEARRRGRIQRAGRMAPAASPRAFAPSATQSRSLSRERLEHDIRLAAA